MSHWNHINTVWFTCVDRNTGGFIIAIYEHKILGTALHCTVLENPSKHSELTSSLPLPYSLRLRFYSRQAVELFWRRGLRVQVTKHVEWSHVKVRTESHSLTLLQEECHAWRQDVSCLQIPTPLSTELQGLLPSLVMWSKWYEQDLTCL